MKKFIDVFRDGDSDARLDRANWRIHQLYIAHEFHDCLSLIDKEINSTNYQCEYPFVVKGLIKRQEGEIDEALELFQRASALNPHNVSTLKHLGRCLYLLGKFEASLNVYEEAEKNGANEWDVWYNRGMCFMHMKKYTEAIEAFQQSNSIVRNDETFIMLAKVYVFVEDLFSAVDTLTEALEFSPDNSDILTSIGLLFLRMNESYRAFDFLGNSLTHDPQNPRTILAAGSIIQDHDDMDVALLKYRVAATRIPNSAQLWNNIGMCFFGTSKYVAAISCLKRALYLDPFEWIISFNLGLVHLKTQQYVTAFHHLSTAINLRPRYACSYMYLAIALIRLNDVENAINAYTKAMELDSSDFRIHLNFSISMFNQGKIRESNKSFDMFFTIWSKADEAVKKQDSDLTLIVQNLRALLHTITNT